MKISITKILYLLLFINPLLSLAFDATKVYYHYLMYPMIMAILLIKEKRQVKQFKLSLIVCVVVVGCELVAIANGGALGKLHNHLFNYIDAILFMIYYTNNSNIQELLYYARRKVNLLLAVVIIINIVEALMVLTKSGYVYVYSWHGTFFRGTSNMPHTLSYLMLATLIFLILYIVITRKKFAAFWALLPTYCVFISGARISLILCALLDAIILSFVLSEKQKNLFLKAIKILPLVAIALFLLKDKILNSDFMMKVTSRASSGNSTAGRTYIWIDLLNRYLSCRNPLCYLFGLGDDKSYYYNSINPLVKSEVWAHNDLVQIIIGKGFLGIVMYLSGIYTFFKKLIRDSGNIYSLTIIAFVSISIVFNGFYSYRDVNLCIPLLMAINSILSYKKKSESYLVTGNEKGK